MGQLSQYQSEKDGFLSLAHQGQDEIQQRKRTTFPRLALDDHQVVDHLTPSYRRFFGWVHRWHFFELQGSLGGVIFLRLAGRSTELVYIHKVPRVRVVNTNGEVKYTVKYACAYTVHDRPSAHAQATSY